MSILLPISHSLNRVYNGKMLGNDSFFPFGKHFAEYSYILHDFYRNITRALLKEWDIKLPVHS